MNEQNKNVGPAQTAEAHDVPRAESAASNEQLRIELENVAKGDVLPSRLVRLFSNALGPIREVERRVK